MNEKDKITGYSPLEKMNEPVLAQFVPAVKNMTDKRCERCEYYSAIDSAYGYCLRYPPKNKIIGIIKKTMTIEYPTVEWHRKGCGEFKN